MFALKSIRPSRTLNIHCPINVRSLKKCVENQNYYKINKHKQFSKNMFTKWLF